jgi:Common central domain of tyrosinase/Polyphenol oxidase middle domain
MSSHARSRRSFLAATGLAAAGIASKPFRTQAQPAAPRIRPNIKSLDPNGPEIAKLSSAFQILEGRDATDPLSWLAQANIHRNSCAHANWWFFPWHRGYLYYFERVLQAAVGDPTLSLPYWDWSDPATRVIPAPFWGSSLYRVQRGIGPNDPAPDEYVDPTAILEPILELTDFNSIGGTQSATPTDRQTAGSLEGSPHNNVHNWVGGAMAVPAWAAQDPIFWLHHANIDRLWDEWSRRNPGVWPTDPAWLNQPFSFYNTDRSAVAITPSQVLTVANLGYSYEAGGTGSTAPPPTAAPRVAAAPRAAAPTVRVEVLPGRPLQAGKPVSVTLPLQPAQHAAVHSLTAPRAVGAPKPIGSVRLTIEGIQPPDDPGVLIRVFLNLPAADANTSFRDPHFAGNFSFFSSDQKQALAVAAGAHGQGGHVPYTQVIDVTAALRRMQASGLYKQGDPLNVTLVAVPIAGRKGPGKNVPFTRIALSVHP